MFLHHFDEKHLQSPNHVESVISLETIITEKCHISGDFWSFLFYQSFCKRRRTHYCTWFLRLMSISESSVAYIDRIIQQKSCGYKDVQSNRLFCFRYGRKEIMVISVLLSTIVGLLRSFSPNYLTYATLEFLDTALGGGMYGGAFILGKLHTLELELLLFIAFLKY